MNDKKKLIEEGEKYCLDVSKLIFGGVILAGIMKQDIKDYISLFIMGSVVFVILLLAGFKLLSISHNKTKKS